MAASRAPATRRRGAVLEDAILRAAIDELAELGYAALTMERVAKRAGTNKNAIYRRWPNRAALGVAAYRQLVRAQHLLPDTGELRGDVLEMLRRVNRESSSPAANIHRSLISSIGDDPELRAQLLELATESAADNWLTLLARGVARGEVPPEALHPRVATVAIVLLRNEYLTRAMAPVPDSVLVEIVEEVYLPLLRGRAGTALANP